jgi:hypothetical protein
MTARRWLLLTVALGSVLVGCAGPPDLDPVHTTATDGRGAIRPLPAPTGCTSTATDPDSLRAGLDAARPGTRLCVLGVMGNTRLTLTRSGSAEAPVEIIGDGHTLVRGITVVGDHIRVEGINSVRAVAPGVELTGNDITLSNCTSISPRGGDDDGLRFFGRNIRIVHNTIRDTLNLDLAHADCMQNFATGPDSPASHSILIEANRCERIDNMCLVAEGPDSSAGDGSGRGDSADYVYRDNYCESHASQALEFDDIQRVSVLDNTVVTAQDKAISFQNGATGATVRGNDINPATGYEVGMDSSSRADYQGPPPGGRP